MRRSQWSVSVTLSTATAIACVCIAVTAFAQQKKPKKAGAATAAPSTAAAAGAPSAKPKPNPKPGHAGHETKPKPGTEEAKPPESEASHAPATAHQVVERESHIEFDERMVRGQSAAGAIYLFNRSPNEFKSIVKVPEGFRPRTVALVAPRGGTP
jgi:hypothetical protein